MTSIDTYEIAHPEVLALLNQERYQTELTLIAAFILLLHRHLDDDFVQANVFWSNKNPDRISRSESANWLNKNHSLSVEVSRDLSFIELRRRIEQILIAGKESEHLEHDSSRRKHIVEIQFSFQIKDSTHLSDVHLSSVDSFQNRLPAIRLLTEDNLIIGTIKYCADSTNTEFEHRVWQHFLAILNDATQHPAKKLSSIKMVGEHEFRKLVYDYNSTIAPFEVDSCLHELIENQVNETPDAIALIHKGQTFTYKQLNEKANHIATHLIQIGVRPDDVVAIVTDLSIEAVTAVLGILKAGGAYLPLGSDCPPTRLQYIIDQSKPKALVLQPQYLNQVQFDSSRTLLLDVVCMAESVRENPETSVAPNHLAYVIYTSGSTAEPKGVMIEHRNVVNNVNLIIERYSLSEHDTVLSMPSLAFDASVSKLFPILTLGGAVVLPEQHEVIDLERLLELIHRYKIPYFATTPSLLRMFNEMNPDLSMLRVVTCGGEALHYRDINNIIRHVPVLNVYGPTEATVSSTSYKVPKNALSGSPDMLHNPVPIGKPNPNCRIYILDRNLNVMPEGCFGTLYIGGAGVGRGYLHDTTLTEEKFVTNPFAPGEKIYNTGDIARWLPDGNLEFGGRRDSLVKIRGYRVSLREIEDALMKHSPVLQCKLILQPNSRGEDILIAFIVTKEGEDYNSINIKVALALCLPSYMIPNEFITIESLPLNQNKKVDIHALKTIYKEKRK